MLLSDMMHAFELVLIYNYGKECQIDNHKINFDIGLVKGQQCYKCKIATVDKTCTNDIFIASFFLMT